jgi:hypothetical protein
MPRKNKQPSPGYKALAEVIIDGIFTGAKHIYNNITAQEGKNQVAPTLPEEPKKPNIPNIARNI